LNKELTQKLESIISIDGKGRPARARMLLEILATVPAEELKAALEEIAARKFF
jgi:hypothetical protein